MKTRYWKDKRDGEMWRLINGSVEFHIHKDWVPAVTVLRSLEADPHIIECTADGTPLSELPADRLTLAEFDAFAARIRANLALLEKEGER